MHLAREAAQVLDGLRGHVVEVDDVAHRVQQREEERCARHDLVELDVRVQRDVLLDGELLQLGQQIARHGEQQQRVAERQGGRRAARDRDAHAHDVTQVRVLGHEGIVCGKTQIIFYTSKRI